MECSIKNANSGLPQTSGTQQLNRIFTVALILLWVVINSILLYHFGIVTTFESEKYISNADHLIEQGQLSSPQFLFYFTQIFIIALAKQSGTFPFLPVIIQLLANAYASICFYKTTILINGSKKVAVYATAALICMYYFQLYNTHLFTESLYYSLSIIYFYHLNKLSKLSISGILPSLFLLCLLYFTRPVGLFFLPASFLFITLKFFSERKLLIFSTVGIVLAGFFLLALNHSLKIGGEFNFLLPYLEGHIICGVPTENKTNIIFPPAETNSIQVLLYLIIHNWNLFLSLATKRFAAFWGVIRSYYSILHNIYIAAYFYLIYILLVVGISNWRKVNLPEIAFMLCLILSTMTTTLLSCDDWHNRFIFAIFPFLLLLATFAFKKPTCLNALNAVLKA